MSAFLFYSIILVLSAIDAVWAQELDFDTLDCDHKGCSHECTTIRESSFCMCPTNMALNGDGKTCGEVTSFLLNPHKIRLINEMEKAETVTEEDVSGIDYHYGRKEVYAYRLNLIIRYPIFKGSSTRKMEIVTEKWVESVAVDWVNNDLYYISRDVSTIQVMSLDGGNKRTVEVQNSNCTSERRELSVDPYARKLFWICDGLVQSSSLDGKDLTDLLSKMRSSDIALDTSNQVIYSIGRRDNSSNLHIGKASYNGNKVEEYIETDQSANFRTYGFGVLQNTAYWLALDIYRDDENLYECDLGSAGTPKAVWVNLPKLYPYVSEMKVFHSNIQKPPNK